MIKEIQRGNTHAEVIDFVMEVCCNCSIPFFMPMYKKRELVKNKESFYCPNGHAQHYTGKSDEQKKIEQLERQRQQDEEECQRLADRLLDEIGKRTKVEKDLKRITKNGVCPCCTRSFVNVKRHIEHMHPEYVGKPAKNLK